MLSVIGILGDGRLQQHLDVTLDGLSDPHVMHRWEGRLEPTGTSQNRL